MWFHAVGLGDANVDAFRSSGLQEGGFTFGYWQANLGTVGGINACDRGGRAGGHVLPAVDCLREHASGVGRFNFGACQVALSLPEDGFGAVNSRSGYGELWLAQGEGAGGAFAQCLPVGNRLFGQRFFLRQCEASAGEVGNPCGDRSLVIRGVDPQQHFVCFNVATSAKVVGDFENPSADLDRERGFGARHHGALAAHHQLNGLRLH